MTLCSDMGSFHIWLARHLYSLRTRQVLISNGQQTLGVGLPGPLPRPLFVRARRFSRFPVMAGICYQHWNCKLPYGSSPTSST